MEQPEKEAGKPDIKELWAAMEALIPYIIRDIGRVINTCRECGEIDGHKQICSAWR